MKQHGDSIVTRRFLLMTLMLTTTFACGAGAVAGLLAASLVIPVASGATTPSVAPNQPAAAATPALASVAAANELEAQIEAVYQSVGSGVVNITSRSLEYDFFLRPVPREGTGSGFFYDQQGHVVTNYHVIQGAEEVQVALEDGRDLQATVVGVDPSTDLAVLRVDTAVDASLVAPVGDSQGLRVGQFTVAIGNPFGLERTLTVGVISSLGRVIESPNQSFIGEVIQTDAPINPGNSGGPLLNLRGEIIGVNSAILSPSGTSAGIGFAIPARTVQRVVPALIRDGRYPHPSLGISAFELTPRRVDLLRQLGIPTPVERGLLIAQVEPGGAAAQAGLRGGEQLARLGNVLVPVGGDIISEIDGEPIATERDLMVHLETRAAVGQVVEVTVFRGSERQTLMVTLGEAR
jgi:S1-C subfamily serine protease